MRKNFQVNLQSELVTGSEKYQVVSQYDLTAVIVGADREVRLVFSPNPTWGIGLPPIQIRFVDVDYLEFAAGFGTRPAHAIFEIGHIPPTLRDDSSVWPEEQSSPEDHLLFRFDSDDDSIRIHSASAFLEVHEPTRFRDGLPR